MNPLLLVTVVLRAGLLLGGRAYAEGARVRLSSDLAETLLLKGRVKVWRHACE